MPEPEDQGQQPVAIWQNDTAVSFERLALLSSEILERVRAYCAACWALRSTRADQIMAAIQAAETDKSALLLSSAEHPAADETWRRKGVSLVLNEHLEPEWSGPSSEPVAGSQAHLLIETSGTSGQPKVARHNLDALRGRLRTGRSRGEPRWLLTYHPATFGGIQVVLTAMTFRQTLIAASQLNPVAMAAAALRHGVTHISATPTFWRNLLLAMGADARRLQLQQITLGGEIADQAILDLLRQTFPQAGITHIYASTEAGSLFAVRDGQAGFPAAWIEEGIDGVSLRIRNGALEVKSPRRMLSYLGTGPLPVTDDGWMVTGDLVEVRNRRGYFLGRASSVISVGGAKVAPEEVESALLALPWVQGARVYGIANPITGFFVGADIVLSPGQNAEGAEARILEHCRTLLPSHKAPRRIRFVESLEISPSGKKRRTN